MRIILADHNRKTLWALRTLLDEEAEVEIVGEAEDAVELQGIAEKGCADLVVVDGRLPGTDVDTLLSWLHALEPKPIVIVMSSDPADSRMMLRAGADAFVSKGERPDWLLATIHRYINRMADVGGM